MEQLPLFPEYKDSAGQPACPERLHDSVIKRELSRIKQVLLYPDWQESLTKDDIMFLLEVIDHQRREIAWLAMENFEIPQYL